MRGRFTFTHKLKYASLAGALASSLGAGAFAQAGGKGASHSRAAASHLPSRGCTPPRTVGQERRAGNSAQRLFLDPAH